MENYSADFSNDSFKALKARLKAKQRQRSAFKAHALAPSFWRKVKAVCITVGALVVLFCAAQGITVWSLLHPAEPAPLSKEEEALLQAELDRRYHERGQLVHPLPYKTVPPALQVYAGAAVLIDATTGDVLFEKNADQKIPPASLTKLVEMYVVFEAVAAGDVALDDLVPLPPESWAVNLPSDASIMFLEQGQRVTLRELLLGLAVASGNDASIAVAHYVAGSMDAFVERMNQTVSSLGLKNTFFVESSGYSEQNYTTPREFAAFCRAYVERFPFALKEFHSQRTLEYPKPKNLPRGVSREESPPVVQRNTNKLLGALEGCDGLKTGFIYESGYNIAVTAERDGARYISVTMRGPGVGSGEGNIYRVKDGTALMEFAFQAFYPYKASETHEFTVATLGCSQKSVKLVPALEESFSVPFIAGDSPKEAACMVSVEAVLPDCLTGPFNAGEEAGEIKFSLNGTLLNTVPLVTDRSATRVSLPVRLWHKAAHKISLLFR